MTHYLSSSAHSLPLSLTLLHLQLHADISEKFNHTYTGCISLISEAKQSEAKQSKAHSISFNTFNLCWCYCAIHTALVHNNVDELLKWILCVRVCLRVYQCFSSKLFQMKCMQWLRLHVKLNCQFSKETYNVVSISSIWLDKQQYAR